MLIAGCNGTASHQDDVLFRAYERGVRATQAELNLANGADIQFLKSKTTSIGYREKAEYWLKVAELVHEADGETIRYIDKLTLRLSNVMGTRDETGFLIANDHSTKLHEHIKEYVRIIWSLEPSLQSELEEKINGIFRGLDSILADKKLADQYFSHASGVFQRLFLEHLWNCCLEAERLVMRYCVVHIPLGEESYASYHAIVGLNTSTIRPGETLTVTAGKGKFDFDRTLKVNMGGVTVPVDDFGMAVYDLKVTSLPGKYILPVTMTFTDQDGKLQTILKDVEYTVIGNK